MTATVTALIDLASQHGFGYAVLILGAQVLLDRLLPVEHLVALVTNARQSGQGRGAHRRTPTPRLSHEKQLCFKE